MLLFKVGSSKTAKTLPGGVIPPHDGSGPTHLAFGMKTEDADYWEQHLIAKGVEIESRVEWNKDDKSIYFRDPDNHLVELITSEHWSSPIFVSDRQRAGHLLPDSTLKFSPNNRRPQFGTGIGVTRFGSSQS